MQHEVTTDTKPHGGNGWGGGGYRAPAAKERAEIGSGEIIAAAIEVHRQLGPGLLESVYRLCLAQELSLRGIAHLQELALPISYKGLLLEGSHRLDLLVEDLVVVELKNFNTDRLTHGLRRMLNG